MTADTEISDMVVSIQNIYRIMIDIEQDEDALTPHQQDSILIGCLGIITGIEYLDSAGSEYWITDTEENVLALAHEYAAWRLENKPNELQ